MAERFTRKRTKDGRVKVTDTKTGRSLGTFNTDGLAAKAIQKKKSAERKRG